MRFCQYLQCEYSFKVGYNDINSRNETEQSLEGLTKQNVKVFGLTAAGRPSEAVDNPDAD